MRTDFIAIECVSTVKNEVTSNASRCQLTRTGRKKFQLIWNKKIVCIKGEIEFGQTPYSQCSQCSQIEAIISRMERLYEIIVRENIDEGILLNAKLYTIITWLRDIHTVHKLWVVKVDWRIYTFLFHIDPIAHLQCVQKVSLNTIDGLPCGECEKPSFILLLSNTKAVRLHSYSGRCFWRLKIGSAVIWNFVLNKIASQLWFPHKCSHFSENPREFETVNLSIVLIDSQLLGFEWFSSVGIPFLESFVAAPHSSTMLFWPSVLIQSLGIRCHTFDQLTMADYSIEYRRIVAALENLIDIY